MTASKENPIYTTYIVSGGTKYNITRAVLSHDFSDQKEQMAQSLKICLANVKVKGTRLSDILSVRDRVYVYANDGNRYDEVYRGFIWTKNTKSDTERELKLNCYDNLIYFQESEDSVFFSKGKSTDSVCKSLCDRWGVKLDYTYSSITHSKLALRGTLSDIFTSDVLDQVRKRTGKKYTIISVKDVMQIKTVGTNTTIYTIKAKKNAEVISSECTMDGMTTKVVILGKADDNDRMPVEATVSGDTSKYGTLQKIILRDENTKLDEAKKEAQSIIDEDGKPKWVYETEGPDIPWIRKGDKVKVEGDLNKYLIVTAVSREISNIAKRMILTLEDE